MNRDIDEKIKLLEKYKTSEELFRHLSELIDTLANDESTDDFSVGDDYNYGTDYDIELVLELISDLRDFTRYNHSDEDDRIITNNLQYLYPYFRG
jgi:hypothetical protein